MAVGNSHGVYCLKTPDISYFLIFDEGGEVQGFYLELLLPLLHIRRRVISANHQGRC